MTLIDRARHLLTCDELRGRVPDEVTAFLREVADSRPAAWQFLDTHVLRKRLPNSNEIGLWRPLYPLETAHEPK